MEAQETVQCSFSIPLKPYSINALYYRDGKRKRAEAVQWEQRISDNFRDKQTQEQLTVIRESFNPDNQGISVELHYSFPNDILYTQEGRLSAKAFDLSNIEKTLIDVIFLKKYSTELCKNLEIDDKFIVKLLSTKKAADDWNIEVVISTLPLKSL